MEIKTGYFAKTSKYLEMGYFPVSIARYTPKEVMCENAPCFAPDSKLLAKYKAGTIHEDEYETQYLSTLNRAFAKIYMESWEKYCKENGFKGVVLLCYEKVGAFCHRHILAKWFDREFHVQVEELLVA